MAIIELFDSYVDILHEVVQWIPIRDILSGFSLVNKRFLEISKKIPIPFLDINSSTFLKCPEVMEMAALVKRQNVKQSSDELKLAWENLLNPMNGSGGFFSRSFLKTSDLVVQNLSFYGLEPLASKFPNLRSLRIVLLDPYLGLIPNLLLSLGLEYPETQASFEGLSTLTNLRELKITCFGEYRPFAFPPNLEILELRSTYENYTFRNTQDFEGNIISLKILKSLSVDFDVHFGDLALENLSVTSSSIVEQELGKVSGPLRKLELRRSNAYTSTPQLPPNLNHLTSLQELTLIGFGSSLEGKVELLRLKRLKISKNSHFVEMLRSFRTESLEYLSSCVYHHPNREISYEERMAFQSLKNLRVLKLAGRLNSQVSYPLFRPFFGQLTYLSLDSPCLNIKQLRALLDLLSTQLLQTLKLKDVSGDGTTMDKITDFENLKSLHLQIYPPIDDEWLTEIANLEFLEVLHLKNNGRLGNMKLLTVNALRFTLSELQHLKEVNIELPFEDFDAVEIRKFWPRSCKTRIAISKDSRV